jgi:hypothetical protein
MARWTHIAVGISILACTGCDRSPPPLEGDRGVANDNASSQPEPAGSEDLFTAFAKALESNWAGGCDIEATAELYRRQTPRHWEMIDLNGDGRREAICVGVHAVYPDRDGSAFIGGATGNAPGYVFELRDERWVQIADISGVDHSIEDERVNGWAVLTVSWKISKREYPKMVLVFEAGEYKKAFGYTYSPTDGT